MSSKYWSVSLIIALIMLMVIAGCSRSKSVNPVSGDDIKPHPGGVINSSGESSDYDANKWDSTSSPFWMYTGSIVPSIPSARISQIRSASAIGDLFDADITQFLLMNPCADCVRISGVGLDSTSENMIIQLQIRHPFEDISRRPDLHVFDVRAIFQSAQSDVYMRITSDLDGDGVASQSETIIPGSTFISNADGYTTHFNTDKYSPNCHPFKRFFENPSGGNFDPDNPSGYNVMEVGSPWETNEFHINLNNAPSYIEFDLIIDASYGQSAVFSTRSDPKFYLPAFNRKEAWSVDINIVNNLLADGNASSYADIDIIVKDWQASATVNPAYPDCTLGEIPYSSGVKEIIVDIPGINSNSLNRATNPNSGVGSNSNPCIFRIRVNNSLQAAQGTYSGIAAVRDDLYLLSGPMGIPEGPEGFPQPRADLTDYTAYAFFSIEVGEAGSVDPPPPDPGDFDIQGPNMVFLGQIIELSIDSDLGDNNFQWSSLSDKIEFVNGNTGNSVQIRGLSASITHNDIQIHAEHNSSEPSSSSSYNITCWGLQFLTPSGDDYRQYINLTGGGQNGRSFTARVQVVPSDSSNRQIHWFFTDPNEPTQPPAADESQNYNTSSDGNDNRGVEDSGFGINLTGLNPELYTSDTGINGIAEAPFTVSKFGGDNYIIWAHPAGIDSSLAVASPTITVWRKFEVPIYSMESNSGTDYYYQPFFQGINDIYKGGYVEIIATIAQGNLPYNSGGATDGAIALDSPTFWPVTEVPAINYLISNSNATENWHKINSCGIKQFGNPAPAGVDPGGVLGIAYSYWQNPEPDPFHFMYYNYIFVCTGRIKHYFGSSQAAQIHVFAHELAHALGLPHNNLEEGDGPHDPFYPQHKWHGGLGLMAASVSMPLNSQFTRAELDFLRGDYGGPYYY